MLLEKQHTFLSAWKTVYLIDDGTSSIFEKRVLLMLRKTYTKTFSKSKILLIISLFYIIKAKQINICGSSHSIDPNFLALNRWPYNILLLLLPYFWNNLSLFLPIKIL